MRFSSLTCIAPGKVNVARATSHGPIASWSIEELETLIEERFKGAMRLEIKQIQAKSLIGICTWMPEFECTSTLDVRLLIPAYTAGGSRAEPGEELQAGKGM